MDSKALYNTSHSPIHTHTHTHTHTLMTEAAVLPTAHQEQFEVQHLAQGMLTKCNWGSRIRASNPLIAGRPALPPEQ